MGGMVYFQWLDFPTLDVDRITKYVGPMGSLNNR